MNALTANPPPGAPADVALSPRFLRLGEVLDLVGASKTTLYKMMRDGRFPRPTRYTPGYVVWSVHAVEGWLDTYRAAPPTPIKARRRRWRRARAGADAAMS